MQPMKVDVLFAFFSYGGNGGINMLLPEIQTWFSKLVLELHDDPRIDRFAHMRFGDVPLTMERNRAVKTAQVGKFDVIVMIDSDNVPDLYLGKESDAKPFFWSSFDFLYDRLVGGLPSVVAAPYCGPPPHPTRGGQENVYVFYAEDCETETLHSGFSFEAYSRQQAATMKGLVPMAAGPTGCIMYSVDAFDLMPVRSISIPELFELYRNGGITLERAVHLAGMQSWFFYEYTDMEQTSKASTEDVTNTREIGLAGIQKHGEPVCFCNWDSWAGHMKPKCVGKPAAIPMTAINNLYREAVEDNLARLQSKNSEELMEVDFGGEQWPDGTAQSEEYDNTPPLLVDSPLPASAPRLQVTPRLIGGRRVMSVGHMTPDHELDALAALVNRVSQFKPEKHLRIVEVGSWAGESALAMHSGLGPAGGTIYCVDTFEGSPTDWTGRLAGVLAPGEVFTYFKQNVGDLIDTDVKVWRGDSVEVANHFDGPQGADIIFLDAGHDYDSIKADIDAWIQHVDSDGLLCGHDWCDAFPGVQRAVKELCDSFGVTPNVLDGTSIWAVQMRDLLASNEVERPTEDTGDGDPEHSTSEGEVQPG